LHKHVRPAISSGHAKAVGYLPSDQYLNLIIHLPVRNQEELTGLIVRLSDPESPDYRRWLSVAQFTQRFGRTEAEYQKVAEFAQANGLAVTYRSPNRLMMVVRGSVAHIETALNVKMRTYQHPTEPRIFYSPDREPSIALDVPVSHISGLNNFSYPRPAAGPRPTQSNDLVGTGSGPNSSFLGSDMRPAYNMGSNSGAGQTVGISAFSGYTASDVSLYFSSVHQTNNVPITNIVVDGGSATRWSNANDEGEVCLDIEQVASVAPGLSQIRVYIGPESFGTGVDGYIFNQMATDNIAKQLSNSWWWSPDDPATDDPYFEEMAVQGQTLFSISGDHGAYTGYNRYDQGYPAEDVHITIVGGTTLITSGPGGPWQSEIAWNDYGEGSGGGPADDGTRYFGIQSWQIPVINSSNGGSTTLRNSPDVALQSDFDNYICYEGGHCATNWGGDSFAAQRWAAWLALVNQQLVANGSAPGLGFLNPALYAIGQSSKYSSDFHDIVSGNNDTNGQLVFYYAVPGYDLVTGWGSMNGVPLLTAFMSYALTVSLNGNGLVASTDGLINCPGMCSHSYAGQTEVMLNATPTPGWAFSGWSGACSGTGSCQVTMTQNANVTASFYQLPVTLTVSVSGSGSVSSTDGFIQCPGTCSHTYDPNTPVTLNAAPASGWTFAGWSGACSGTGQCNLTMLGNYGVSAYFYQAGSGLQFSAVTPCRLVDTRQTGQPIQGGTSQNFNIPQLGGCNIPTSASAYSLNVTVIPRGTLGYITVWPAGLAQPLISTMNSRDGRNKAEAVIVQAGTNNAVSIYATNTTDVLLDVNGYFGAPGSQTYEFFPLTSCRVIDTRGADSELGGPPLVGGQARNFDVMTSSCMPQGPGIKAYSFNVTVVPYPGGQPLRYLTVWPEGVTQPTVSTLNNRTATSVANAAIVPAGTPNGGISVYASDSSQLIVDINGYFAASASGGLSLYPTAPCRVIDTRSGGGQPWQGEKTINVVGSPCAPPANAEAYVFNATVIPPGAMHYLTLWPDPQQKPNASTLNAIDGAVTSNLAIVPNTDGSTDAFASDATQLILDISSFFAP
jgi:Pro-kumamolisin, activation domain/Divergent InlB B-repeat domain